jgi:PKD repeat protein
VRGKKNPKWTLSKEGDPNFENIYYNNKYFSYMFTKRGNYSVSLDLEDSNGNIRNVTKKEIIKII